jgi:hypothetical protein
MDPTIDVKRLRGVLAEAMVSNTALARASKLSRTHVQHVLTGKYPVGELARIKLWRGLVALGLDREVRHA